MYILILAGFSLFLHTSQVRRRLLRLLNLARVIWDKATGAVYLLRPAADPNRPGKVLST